MMDTPDTRILDVSCSYLTPATDFFFLWCVAALVGVAFLASWWGNKETFLKASIVFAVVLVWFFWPFYSHVATSYLTCMQFGYLFLPVPGFAMFAIFFSLAVAMGVYDGKYGKLGGADRIVRRTSWVLAYLFLCATIFSSIVLRDGDTSYDFVTVREMINVAYVLVILPAVLALFWKTHNLDRRFMFWLSGFLVSLILVVWVVIFGAVFWILMSLF